MCNAGLPTGIPPDLALILLVVNIFLPGLGTAVAGGAARPTNCLTVFIGFCQILTFPLLIGWIWAICWSLSLLDKAKKEHKEHKEQVHKAQHAQAQHKPQRAPPSTAPPVYVPPATPPLPVFVPPSPPVYVPPATPPPPVYVAPKATPPAQKVYDTQSSPQKGITAFEPPPGPQLDPFPNATAYEPTAPPAEQVEGVPPPPAADTPLPRVPRAPPPLPRY